MSIVRTLRSAFLITGLALAAFGVASFAAPGEAHAGYWTQVCNPYGCTMVYVPTWTCGPFGCAMN